MSRSTKKVDTIQGESIKILRQWGFSVQPIHTIGNGCPDLLVGYSGINYLLELKSEGGELNENEYTWHLCWNGQAVVIEGMDGLYEWIAEIISNNPKSEDSP